MADVGIELAVALDQMGQSGPAEAALLRAQSLDPDDPGTPYALAVFYMQKGKKAQALEWAERLRVLRPNDPQVVRLIATLHAAP